VDIAADLWTKAPAMPNAERAARRAKLSIKKMYECKFIVNKELYDWFCKWGEDQTFERVLRSVSNVVKDNGIKNVSIFLKGGHIQQIETVKEGIQRVLVYDVFDHKYKHVLFTSVGREKMKHISSQAFGVCYIHWDNKTRTIRIYGSIEQRRAGIDLINRCVILLIAQTNQT